ncbi:ABC transporter substrate-binding protein [Bacillus testis]|uniref:ABC transporter substrate-binding protein n=1 Tax=Bacillus testis TaxID=1622072 RepID=UPI00067F0CC4|nr:ABC transporter substrate-binding protein [Bacillus testis]
MKKFIKPAVAVLASAMLLATAACSSDESTSEASSSDKSKGQTITVGSWKGSEAEAATYDKLLEAFTEKTGIKVKKRIYNDYATQLQTDLIGGTAPDVFYVDVSEAPALIEQGVLEPLDSYIDQTKDFNKDDFYKPAYKGFTGPDKKQYGIPKDNSTLGLFYNETLLNQAGVDPATIPTEITEWPAFLKDLQSKLPKGKQAFVSTPELARHMHVMQANGTSIVDKDGYAVLSKNDQLQYMQMYVDAYKSKLINSAKDLGQGNSGDSFGVEAAAIMLEGNWGVANLQQNFPNVKFGTIEHPTIGGKHASMMYTVSYSMNAQSEKKEAAWEFINYVTGTEGMKLWAEGAGVIPSRESVTAAMNLKDNKLMAPFIAAADYATTWQNGTTLPIIMREYNNMLPAAIKGEMSLKAAMKKAEASANKDIKTQLKN